MPVATAESAMLAASGPLLPHSISTLVSVATGLVLGRRLAARLPGVSWIRSMRALIVEDDRTIAAFLIKGLKEAGFAVDHAADGDAGVHLATAVSYDVAVVDLMLPLRDGLSLITELRARHVATPVLILSARHSVDDRVKGLESGGDDYLTKPFAFAELLARVQALIRRSQRGAVGDAAHGRRSHARPADAPGDAGPGASSSRFARASSRCSST